jgi:hypothetical protein
MQVAQAQQVRQVILLLLLFKVNNNTHLPALTRGLRLLGLLAYRRCLLAAVQVVVAQVRLEQVLVEHCDT